MTGKNHLLFGLGTGTVLFWEYMFIQQDETFLTTMNALSVCVPALIGSVLPDVDNQKSWLGRKIKPIAFVINKVFGHRTIFHSLLLPLMICCVMYFKLGNWNYMENIYFISFLTGYMGHLLQDALTHGGTPLLYPFIKSNISLTNISYGSKKERTVTICLILVYAFIVYKKNTFF